MKRQTSTSKNGAGYKAQAHIQPSEITPEAVFNDRRLILKNMLGWGVGIGSGALLINDVVKAEPVGGLNASGEGLTPLLKNVKPTAYGNTLSPNSWDEITGYNNFYEFGVDKADPKANAHTLRPKPWQVSIQGECDIKGNVNLEDLLKGIALEERIYRLRCVEAWSMVIPWVGVPLSAILAKFKPNSKAKFVKFQTLLDPKQMPGQSRAVLDWPYVEGLRIDEAMHPLTLLAVGVYGRELPNQNGAPLRLVVPWKYGFKSIKSIVKIEFSDKAPTTSWMNAASQEYGFFANVNPAVNHPRWSQASERRIGSSLFAARVPTLPFNGYADEVASLYTGMDLKRYF